MIIDYKDVISFPRDKKTMVEYVDKGVWFGEYRDDKLVGVTNLVNNNKIKSVYVLKEYRGQGIAYKLITEALSQCEKCKTLALDSSKDLFMKCGFTINKITEYKLGTVYDMRWRRN